MRRAVIGFVSIIVLSVAVAAAASGGDASRPAPHHTIVVASPDRWAQLATAERVADYVHALDQARLADYLHAVAVGDLVQYLEAQTPPPTTAPPISEPILSPPVSGGGAHSDAWWHAISICEQGGRNDPFFGYFSVMDGSAGGLDWSTQVAMANGIISRYGDGAWAGACVAQAYTASPSG